MTRLSSNWTIFYKIFIPTFWIVFIGACVAVTWGMGVNPLPGIGQQVFAIFLTVVYILGILFFYMFTMRLKRIEIDENYIYITNYFKNYRYPHQDIDWVEEHLRPAFSTASFHLKASGSLGKKLRYLPVKGWLHDFLREHPEVEIEVK